MQGIELQKRIQQLFSFIHAELQIGKLLVIRFDQFAPAGSRRRRKVPGMGRSLCRELAVQQVEIIVFASARPDIGKETEVTGEPCEENQMEISNVSTVMSSEETTSEIQSLIPNP